MNAIQQKCRPKHQVLVLKCYPRTTKGAVDVKPNSSELSYLLFYATSRRAKIQKVGNFLEKKTASDVWRLHIGNVQVTLQILAALIEKSPKDLPLFAHNVLKVLGLVLRSNDITMVEASLPTFETFCEHHDPSSLFADQAYVRQYEEIVKMYASLASTKHTPGKGTPSKPVAMRWRNAGLEAIKSVAESDALASTAGRQLTVIVPMVLENLWTNNDQFLDMLIQRAQPEEKGDPSQLLRRRTSISTVRTAEEGGDTNPIAFSGTAGDVDKLAEEDINVTALLVLKQIFGVANRGQIFGATTALLKFIRGLIQANEKVVVTDKGPGSDSGWAIQIFALVARWAPVQDRYVILVTAMDTLVKTAPTADNIQEQIVLTAMIAALLRSDINLIGLSVMDVLLGLLQHIRRILKYSSGTRNGSGGAATATEKPATSTDNITAMNPEHKDLLNRIQHAIGDLASHVYYADQISDMISAVLLRLKPHPSNANASPPGEKAESQTAPGASVGNLSDDNPSDNFFAMDIAKTVALKAVKSILLVANPKTKITGNVNLTRNRVPIQVWEGTHWLLRDPDGQVRKAYADAVVTWLDRETTRADLKARDEIAQKQTRVGNRELPPATNFARRAASSASNRERPVKVHRSHFLQLIHLAIYDNALQFLEFETDIALLHVLLAKFVLKLGLNAARYGLPMIFRLQEDIQEAETPLAKVRLGSLCHGYFWAVSEKFDFESSVVGRAIHNEISRRRTKHFWIEGINIPPPLVELVGTPGMQRPQPKMPTHEVESEALLPFDDRLTMVDCICTGYSESKTSPPASPAVSPGRNFTHPVLSSSLSTIPPAEADHEVPPKFREDMLIEWTREAAVIALQAGSRSASLNGSKTGTATTKGNRLAVNGPLTNGHAHNGAGSLYGSQTNLRPASHAGGFVAALRKTSLQSRTSARSASSRAYVASIDQLKSVLTGDAVRPPTMKTVRADDDSDSMASYEFTPSELSFNPNGDGSVAGESTLERTRSKTKDRRASGDDGGPLTSHPTEDEGAEEVPPVPPLPTTVEGKSVVAIPEESQNNHTTPLSPQSPNAKAARRSLKSRGGDSILSSNFADSVAASMDLQSLLKGIDSKARDASIGNLTRPPY